MDILELARKLDIPGEVVSSLAPVPEAAPYLHGLCGETYEANATALHEAIGRDENGLKILSAMLEAALLTWEEYARRGISEKTYFATMGCFSRFIREHMESFGVYGFDRWWWTGRQTSLQLFRIGSLEYELGTTDGKKWISVHIPSDADLSDEALDESLSEAHAFLHKFFPAYESVEFHCHSWLLSPTLGKLLPESSRINRFRNRFELQGFDEEADDYKLWVYKNKFLRTEDFPENTTLQKNMKEFLLQGGKVGAAWGKIR